MSACVPPLAKKVVWRRSNLCRLLAALNREPAVTGTVGRHTMHIEPIPLQTHGDSRGMLVSLEQERNVPFPIRRVYYLFATSRDVHRGMHAHRRLNQLAVAVRGSVTFLLDDGSGPTEVTLDDPAQGLLLGSMVWRDLYAFSDDCVLMVLADQLYDPADYITDYDEFLREVRGVPRVEGTVAW
ncbi:dTDP-4-dehydrorhamnose 3,5-epimerase [Luteibacter sp. UNCMF366Tsu5.1]|nr:dTDP-4-dehydrorhamnose 3,5-epimerase [Luteibacter sp. UNCMF366Tsu5.1]